LSPTALLLITRHAERRLPMPPRWLFAADYRLPLHRYASPHTPPPQYAITPLIAADAILPPLIYCAASLHIIFAIMLALICLILLPFTLPLMLSYATPAPC